VTPEATRERARARCARDRRGDRADSIAKTPHALLSRGVAGVRGATLVVNLPGSPGGCRDGFAVLQPALGTRSSCSRARRPRTGRRERAPSRALRALVKIEHTIFALPFAYVGALPRGRRRPVGARPALDHGRDGRRALARDGR
jgi:hypothetical protein